MKNKFKYGFAMTHLLVFTLIVTIILFGIALKFEEHLESFFSYISINQIMLVGLPLIALAFLYLFLTMRKYHK